MELEAIQRAVLFARATDARLYICHMTIAEGAEFLKQESGRCVYETDIDHRYLLTMNG